MRKYRICTGKYETDLSALARKRLHGGTILDTDSGSVTIGVNSVKEAADVICDILLHDLSQLELADIVNEVPAPVEYKRQILIKAIDYAQRAALHGPVLAHLMPYLCDNNTINAEGYITFRMRDTAEIWERCAERAAEDVFMQDESDTIRTLFHILKSYKLCIVINSDGSYTLIDEGGAYVDLPSGREENVMSIILSLSPIEITVCDRSDGGADEMICALRRSFPDKVYSVDIK